MFANLYEKASKQNDVFASQQDSPSKTKKRRRRRKNNRNAPAKSSDSSDDVVERSTKRKYPSDPSPSRSKRLRRQQGPSEEALALSAKLKEYSSQKRLNDALQLYWHESNDSVRDGHHACILIDCAARCGSISEGEKVIDEMKKAGIHINVQAKTALLKGYAHSGMIRKGAELFEEMCRSKDKQNRPNVRTLNTLLRGCLWTAATNDRSQQLVGGIATSDACWKLYSTCISSNDMDCSSYEYYIAQLCYALRVEDAKEMIDRMKRKNDIMIDKKVDKADPSVVESLAVSFLALARALTLLNRYDGAAVVARNALDVADMAKRLLQERANDSSNQTALSAGGKRGWKKDEDTAASRRAVSNSLFRSHRLSEVRSEASDLLSICYLRPDFVKSKYLAFYLVTRLLYFSGGGTTDFCSTQQHKSTPSSVNDSLSIRIHSINALWHSFGLQVALKQALPDSKLLPGAKVLTEQDLLQVQDAVGLRGASVISEDGFIDFREVFRIQSSQRRAVSSTEHTDRALDIEIGSGFGDWIVRQAIRNSDRDFVAVEMRADRVAQTFAKVFLNGFNSPLSNVCCVGSECGSFLRERVRQGSVATIFVNHPEPPTQTYGANNQVLSDIANGGNEPAHMLNSETLTSASKCLQADGRFIIITDNHWYARLICVTFVKAMKSRKGLFCTSELKGSLGIRQVETFGDSRSRVTLYASIGHSDQIGTGSGSSYFDRLWRIGAGAHAEKKKRFIISMEREQDGGNASSPEKRGREKGDSQTAKADKGGKQGKKNRKKGEAKQKRRNERRLAKRQEATGQTTA